MTDHTRYLCRTCAVEFVDGGWIIVNNQQSVWTEADGCIRCRGPVERITYRPSVPGLDIPDHVRRGPIEPPQPLQLVASADRPLPVRANDHYGINDVLAPDPRKPKPDLWQLI